MYLKCEKFESKNEEETILACGNNDSKRAQRIAITAKYKFQSSTYT